MKSARELEEWLREPHIAAAAPPEREALPSEWARSRIVRFFGTAFQEVIVLPLFRTLLTLRVTGRENLEGIQPPVIFAANHTSHLDVPTIYAALSHHYRWRLAPAMMQDHFRAYFEPEGHSWKEVAVTGLAYFLACSIFNAYPLPQQMSGARRALKYTGDLISRGYCPLVFPEGLRTSDGKMHSFRPGVGMMAIRLRVPVVPIRLSGLYEIYSVHDSWPRRGPVSASIGRPMQFPATMSYDEAARRLEERMREL